MKRCKKQNMLACSSKKDMKHWTHSRERQRIKAKLNLRFEDEDHDYDDDAFDFRDLERDPLLVESF